MMYVCITSSEWQNKKFVDVHNNWESLFCFRSQMNLRPAVGRECFLYFYDEFRYLKCTFTSPLSRLVQESFFTRNQGQWVT